MPQEFIALSTDRVLHISKNIISLPLKNIQCELSNVDTSSKLLIHFERDVQILFRRRRSASIFFEKSFYSIEVKEDTPKGSVILELKVTGGSGKYSFKKTEDLKTDTLFEVDKDSGEIVLLQELNREDGAERFSIDIRAIDANVQSSATTTVKVKVLDVNDNAPTFTQNSYSKTVDEGQASNKYILTVRATDADDGINREIIYSIVKKNGVHTPFEIDPRSGAIKSTEKLDREKKPFYNFSVKAEDQGEIKKSSQVDVSIALNDINDNAPKFSQEKYKFSIPESTKVGSVVYKVIATDADIGSNGVIEFNSLPIKRFRINTTSGEIILNEEVDFDRYQRESAFTVVVFDKGSPPKYANAEVEVYQCIIKNLFF